MKDVTFGVKVPEDLRDEINELMKDSGLIGREFMQELIDAYMLDKGKAEVPEMSEEIKELQSLTHRINEMYIYLGKRFKDISKLSIEEREGINAQLDKVKKNCEKEVKLSEDKINQLKNEELKLQDEIKVLRKEKQEADKDNEELSSYNQSLKDLNLEYKSRIAELEKELDSLSNLKDENDSLLRENNKLKEHNDNLASELWFSKREIEGLNNKLSENKEKYKNSLDRVNKQHKLEKQSAILEVQLEHQKIVDKLNNKLVDIQTQYNEKLKEVLFDLDRKSEGRDKNDNRKDTTN